MSVHNHGPNEGRGLDCGESVVDGELKGWCMRTARTPADDAVHWVGQPGEGPTSLHGNGAASFAHTSGDEDEVTCTLCLTLLARPSDDARGCSNVECSHSLGFAEGRCVLSGCEQVSADDAGEVAAIEALMRLTDECLQSAPNTEAVQEDHDIVRGALTEARAEADRHRATLAAVGEWLDGMNYGHDEDCNGNALNDDCDCLLRDLWNLRTILAADPVSLADVRVVDRVANLLCERHQVASPTRQPCAACVQDAYAATGADPLWMSPAADPVSLADVREPTDKQVMDAFGEMG